MTSINHSPQLNWLASLRSNPKDLGALLVIIAVGAVLRFYHLGTESLWIDEIASWNQSRKGSISSVIEGMRRNVHPPGWTFLLHYVQKTLGDSEVALRMPSAIAGVVAIPAIYALGHKVFDKKTGLIAAAIIAVMWSPIYYSQESRAYSLLMLLSITTTFTLIGLLEKIERHEPIFKAALLYIFMAAATAYLHYAGLLLIAIQGCWAGLRCLRNPRHLGIIILIFAGIVTAYLPWLFEMFTDFNREKFWIRNIASIDKTINFFFFKDGISLTWWIGLLVAVAATATAVKYRANPLHIVSSASGLIFAWLLMPYAAFYLKSILSTPILLPRYILVSAPAIYLVCAFSLSKLVFNRATTLGLCALVISGGLWVMSTKLNYYTTPQKAQFKEVIETLSNSKNVPLENSFVMSYRSSNVFNYYFSHMGIDREVDYRIKIDKKTKGRPVPAEEIVVLRELIEKDQKPHVWLIVGNPRTPWEVLNMMNENYDVMQHYKFKNTQAILYSRRQ